MTDVRDDPKGSAAINKYQGTVRGTYITSLKAKDREHFGARDGNRGPLKSLFRHMEFMPLVFGTFGECSSNVKAVLDMAVEDGVDTLEGRWRRRR